MAKELLATEIRKTQIIVNKPVYLIYLGLSVLDLRKTVISKFWYDYVKTKYDENEMLCNMDTDNFIVDVKADGFDKDIAEDAETRYIILLYNIILYNILFQKIN